MFFFQPVASRNAKDLEFLELSQDEIDAIRRYAILLKRPGRKQKNNRS